MMEFSGKGNLFNGKFLPKNIWVTKVRGKEKAEYDIKNSYLNICHYNYYIGYRTENNTRTNICSQC